jgi:hypothetical protein
MLSGIHIDPLLSEHGNEMKVRPEMRQAEGIADR